MTLALVRLLAPPRKLGVSALVSALVTGLLWSTEIVPNAVPYLACVAAWLGSWQGPVFQRVGLWERAWPVSEQALLRARVMAPSLVGWVPTLASLVTTCLFWSLGAVSTAELGISLLDGASLLALIPVFMFMGRHFERGEELALSIGLGLVALIVTAACLRLPLGRYASAPSMAVVFGFAAVSALIAYLALRGSSWFEAARARAARGRGAAVRTKVASVAASRAAPLFIVMRALYGPSAFWMLLLLVWPIGSFVLWRVARFDLILWSWVVNGWLAVHLGTVKPMPLPGHLPVSPRRVFALLLAPLCLFASLEHALESPPWLEGTRALSRGAYGGQASAAAAGGKIDFRLQVPSLFWRATLGEPPPIRTPNGEVRHPWSYRVFPGLPFTVYNPYDVRLADEYDLVLSQVSRALREVSSVDFITAADIERACEESASEWHPHPARRPADAPGVASDPERDEDLAWLFWSMCLTDLRVEPHLPPAWSVLKLWFAALILWVSFRAQLYSLRLPDKWRHLPYVALNLISTAIFLVRPPFSTNDPTDNWHFAVEVLFGELTRLSQRSPVPASVLGLAVLGVLYWELFRRFRRAELFSGRRTAR